MDAESFAHSLLGRLRNLDPRAAGLRIKGKKKTAIIGIYDEGELVPLLKLTGASAKFNVMSLLVYHHGGWVPTLKRGTPELLAEPLAGPLQHLWIIPLEMACLDPD